MMYPFNTGFSVSSAKWTMTRESDWLKILENNRNWTVMGKNVEPGKKYYPFPATFRPDAVIDYNGYRSIKPEWTTGELV